MKVKNNTLHRYISKISLLSLLFPCWELGQRTFRHFIVKHTPTLPRNRQGDMLKVLPKFTVLFRGDFLLPRRPKGAVRRCGYSSEQVNWATGLSL